MVEELKEIGFIGLGTMGMPMAVNLLKQSFSLTVYNRTAAKSAEIAAQGAQVVDSPAALARAVHVLITNVSNDQALIDVILGTDGIIEGTHDALTIINCSTVSPETSRRVADELNLHGVAFIDAPVTGSKPKAIDGTLVFMVGGTAQAIQEQADVFAAMGETVVHLGGVGSGSAAKIAHNTIVGINAAALAEGMAMAVKAGVDPEKFLTIVKAGGANSKMAELKGLKIIERDFSNQFSLSLMLKDLLLASEQNRLAQLPSPMLHSAVSLFQIGASMGLGEQDLSSVIQCYESWMKLEVTKSVPSADQDDSVDQVDDRRDSQRMPLDLPLNLTIYEWSSEGKLLDRSFAAKLYDLSYNGIQIGTDFPLEINTSVVIHFPKETNLPPATAKVIRTENWEGAYRCGCLLFGQAPYIRAQLEPFRSSN